MLLIKEKLMAKRKPKVLFSLSKPSVKHPSNYCVRVSHRSLLSVSQRGVWISLSFEKCPFKGDAGISSSSQWLQIYLLTLKCKCPLIVSSLSTLELASCLSLSVMKCLQLECSCWICTWLFLEHSGQFVTTSCNSWWYEWSGALVSNFQADMQTVVLASIQKV